MEYAADVTASRSTSQGRGWLGRNWTALTGLSMYVIVAIADAAGIVYPSRDWFELFIWGSVAGLLVAWWFANSTRRDQWKAERRSALVVRRDAAPQSSGRAPALTV
jgi:hypothetical protein